MRDSPLHDRQCGHARFGCHSVIMECTASPGCVNAPSLRVEKATSRISARLFPADRTAACRLISSPPLQGNGHADGSGNRREAAAIGTDCESILLPGLRAVTECSTPDTAHGFVPVLQHRRPNFLPYSSGPVDRQKHCENFPSPEGNDPSRNRCQNRTTVIIS